MEVSKRDTAELEGMTPEQFDRLLVKRIASVNELSEEHVISRRNVKLDMTKLSVDKSDFSDDGS